MKSIISKAAAAVAVIVEYKKKTNLFIIRLTNLKAFSTIESIVISMTN